MAGKLKFIVVRKNSAYLISRNQIALLLQMMIGKPIILVV